MHFKRLLIKVQESSPKAIKIAKTPELPGTLPPGPPPGRCCPWTPQGALERAPGPHAVMAHTLLLARLESFQHCFLGMMGALSKMTGNFKILAKALFRTHINDMLLTLGFMSVRDHITYATGCMMYKARNDIAPAYINNHIKQISTVHSRCTRSSEDGKLYIPKCNTNYGQNTFHYEESVLWNVISKDIREVNSLLSFKLKMKYDLKLQALFLSLCLCEMIHHCCINASHLALPLVVNERV